MTWARRFAVLALVCWVPGCSVALEELRLTYDGRVVVPGATRAAIEAQLGRPDTVTAHPDRSAQAIYSTSRVTQQEKASIVAGHVEGDGLTLGLAEIFDPALIAEHEARMFRVDYSPAGIAVTVSMRCQDGPDRRWRAIETAPARPCAGGAVPL